jgi:hypothetical protein
MKNEVKFERVANGQFKVLVNGADSGWEIFNGSMGASGRGNNIYGIHKSGTETYRQIGSLQACKKMLAFTLQKESK